MNDVANRVVQITGFPRSGTAFMAAVAMLNPDATVYHEAFCDMPKWPEEIREACDTKPLVVDCSTYGFLPKAVIPSAAKVFLYRPLDAAAAAVDKAFGVKSDPAALDAIDTIAADWLEKWDPLVVQFRDLFSVDAVRRIWTYCDFGPFPEAKVAQLIRMRIVRKDADTFTDKALSDRFLKHLI